MDLQPAGNADVVTSSNNINIHIDPFSAHRAKGLTIDFIEGPGGGGFKIDNPNAPAKVIDLTPAEMKTLRRPQ